MIITVTQAEASPMEVSVTFGPPGPAGAGLETPLLYDNTATYAKDATVSFGGVWYISLIDENQDNQPDVSPDQWAVWFEGAPGIESIENASTSGSGVLSGVENGVATLRRVVAVGGLRTNTTPSQLQLHLDSIEPWSSNPNYMRDHLVTGQGTIWQSKTTNNQNNPLPTLPDTENDHWRVLVVPGEGNGFSPGDTLERPTIIRHVEGNDEVALDAAEKTVAIGGSGEQPNNLRFVVGEEEATEEFQVTLATTLPNGTQRSVLADWENHSGATKVVTLPDHVALDDEDTDLSLPPGKFRSTIHRKRKNDEDWLLRKVPGFYAIPGWTSPNPLTHLYLPIDGPDGVDAAVLRNTLADVDHGDIIAGSFAGGEQEGLVFDGVDTYVVWDPMIALGNLGINVVWVAEVGAIDDGALVGLHAPNNSNASHQFLTGETLRTRYHIDPGFVVLQNGPVTAGNVYVAAVSAWQDGTTARQKRVDSRDGTSIQTNSASNETYADHSFARLGRQINDDFPWTGKLLYVGVHQQDAPWTNDELLQVRDSAVAYVEERGYTVAGI